ncbi:MAG: PQQ-binding-like beta-propeller repeat protein [Gemmataceae bacterium]
MRRMIAASFLAALAAAPLTADDWPQFRGPNRDGLSKEKGLLQEWPKDGPPLEWSIKGLGSGYSSVSIAGDRIYTVGNKNGDSHLVALERDGGKQVWTAKVGPQGDSLGSTPTVDGENIYVIGQQGDLVCVDKYGKEQWRRHFIKEFKGQKGGWHYCESPLIDGDHIVVTPGGTEATIVALNKKSGETVWKCPIKSGSPQAGYSSVVVETIKGVKQYVQLYNGGVVGVDTKGNLLWQYKRHEGNTANVPTPIVIGDHVFSSIGYGGRGAALLKINAEGKTFSAEEIYYEPELKNKHGGVIKVGEYVYGDHDDSGHPFCAEVKTGKVMWKRKNQGNGGGSAAVTYADNRLYFHYQNGVTVLAKASPDGYEEVGSFKPKDLNGASWAHPVVSDGRLYLREGDFLHCYDVRKK